MLRSQSETEKQIRIRGYDSLTVFGRWTDLSGCFAYYYCKNNDKQSCQENKHIGQENEQDFIKTLFLFKKLKIGPYVVSNTQ